MMSSSLKTWICRKPLRSKGYWRRLVVLSFVLLLCGTFSFAQTEEQTVGGALLSPTGYRLQARAGLKATLPFTIANPGQTRTRIALRIVSHLPQAEGEAAQEQPQAEGQPVQENAGHARDASGWFPESAMDIELAAGEERTVRLKYETPRGISAGSYWCVLRFSAKPVASVSTAAVELNAPIIFTLGRERPQAKVSSPVLAKVNKDMAKSPLAVLLPLENIGKNVFDIGATGEITNVVTRRTVTSLEARDSLLYPGLKTNLTFAAPEIPDGHYRLTFRAEIGSRRLPPVSAEFVVLKGEPSAATEALTMALPPVSIDPQGFSLVAPAGSVRSQTLRFTNLSDREITLDLEPRSVEQTKSGSIGLSEEPLPSGLKVMVAPAAVTIRPRSLAVARLMVTADKGMEGEKWFGLSLTERGNANAFSETVLGSIVIKDTTKPELEVVNNEVDLVNGRPMGVRFAIRNTGNQALQLVPTAAILEGGIRLVARLEVPIQGSGGILPNAELPNLVMLPHDLKPGNYVVEISYQYGKELFAKARVPIKVEALQPNIVAKKKQPKSAESVKANAQQPVPARKSTGTNKKPSDGKAH